MQTIIQKTIAAVSSYLERNSEQHSKPLSQNHLMAELVDTRDTRTNRIATAALPITGAVVDRISMLGTAHINYQRELGIHADAAAHHVKRVEDRINYLYSESTKQTNRTLLALAGAAKIANTSTDPYELKYTTGMFIHQPEVIQAIAENHHIDEQTQAILLSTTPYRDSLDIHAALAANPALSASAAEHLERATRAGQFGIRCLLTDNLAMISRESNDPKNPHANLCLRIASMTDNPNEDSLILQKAIAGVRDPHWLHGAAQIVTSGIPDLGTARAIFNNPDSDSATLKVIMSNSMTRLAIPAKEFAAMADRIQPNQPARQLSQNEHTI